MLGVPIASSFHALAALVCALAPTCMAASISVISQTTLGPDPPTVNRLNGESFQQEALVTFNGYQYGVHYLTSSTNISVRHPAVSRRALSPLGSWETLMLEDYDQVLDDGHDVITIGISHGDGTVHISFDQHDNNLNYRLTQPGVATDPTNVNWTASLFRPTQALLPGTQGILDPDVYFINVTYPRFLSIPSQFQGLTGSDLLLELRVGQSGLGDDWLYRYTPASPTANGTWALIGRYLQGVNNNAYINGLDFDAGGRLHTTWTYRDFVNPNGQPVNVEAGPNGPENNHGMLYGYSPDLGQTWFNTWNQTVANMSALEPIVPVSAGINIFDVPKFGGILNQEAQTIDGEGRVHVLNRENGTGVEQWYHYWKSTTWHWTRDLLPLDLPSVNNITNTPTVIGKRGKIVPHVPTDSILLVLPSNAPNSTALSILRSTAPGHFRDWEVLWESTSGCAAEPLFDRYRLDMSQGGDGVLSLYVVNGTEVQVLDFDLGGL